MLRLFKSVKHSSGLCKLKRITGERKNGYSEMNCSGSNPLHNRHIPALPPSLASWSGKGRPCKVWSWGRPHALIQALQFRKKGSSSIILGELFTWTTLAITAMTSPSLNFLPLVMMHQHCLRCSLACAWLARLLSHPSMFHMFFCVFHIPFYSNA